MIVSPLPCPHCGGPKSINAAMCRACKHDRQRERRPFDELTADPATISRFLGKVAAPNERGCRLWLAHIATETGYGQFGIAQKIESAHVVSYWMFVGPVPAGEFVLHRCDIRACVEPTHLFTGDNSINLMDCAAKGRINTQKLTADDVRAIRLLYGRGGITQNDLAERFGVGQSQVNRILLRQTWRFVE